MAYGHTQVIFGGPFSNRHIQGDSGNLDPGDGLDNDFFFFWRRSASWFCLGWIFCILFLVCRPRLLRTHLLVFIKVIKIFNILAIHNQLVGIKGNGTVTSVKIIQQQLTHFVLLLVAEIRPDQHE